MNAYIHGAARNRVRTPKHPAAPQHTVPRVIPQTACRPVRRERAIARRAVTKRFGPGDTTAKAQSAATESKIVIWSIQYPQVIIHNRRRDASSFQNSRILRRRPLTEMRKETVHQMFGFVLRIQ